MLSDDFVIAIAIEETSFIGQKYVATCEVSRVLGLTNDPVIEWQDSQGNPVTSAGGVTVGNPTTVEVTTGTDLVWLVTMVTLEFAPLNTPHGKEYTCEATLQTSEILVPRTAELDLIINGRTTLLTKNGSLL